MSLIPEPKAVDFLPASDGSLDFGLVDDVAAKVLGVNAGPIRLQVGFPGSNGWGAKHILSNDARMERIKGLGFRTVSHYVQTVARNFQRISDGGGGRLALVYEFQREGTETVHLEVIVMPKECEGSTIWSVTTLIPKSVSRLKVLYTCPKKEKGRTESCGSSLGGVSNRPRRETLSLPKFTVGDGKGS